jgi:hypothetical protein
MTERTSFVILEKWLNLIHFLTQNSKMISGFVYRPAISTQSKIKFGQI